MRYPKSKGQTTSMKDLSGNDTVTEAFLKDTKVGMVEGEVRNSDRMYMRLLFSFFRSPSFHFPFPFAFVLICRYRRWCSGVRYDR